MSEAIIEALRRRYMESVGNPARQLIGGGVRGYLGLDQPEYADQLGREAYANAQALGNAPGIGAPAGAFKAMASAPLMVKALRAYHGSRAPDIEAFDTAGHHAQKVAGAYFSKNPKEASRYAKGEGGTVYPVDLMLKKPAQRADLDALPTRVNGEFPDGVKRRQMLQERGFDSLIDDLQDEIVVFDPAQIIFALRGKK